MKIRILFTTFKVEFRVFSNYPKVKYHTLPSPALLPPPANGLHFDFHWNTHNFSKSSRTGRTDSAISGLWSPDPKIVVVVVVSRSAKNTNQGNQILTIKLINCIFSYWQHKWQNKDDKIKFITEIQPRGGRRGCGCVPGWVCVDQDKKYKTFAWILFSAPKLDFEQNVAPRGHAERVPLEIRYTTRDAWLERRRLHVRHSRLARFPKVLPSRRAAWLQRV